MTGWSIPMDEIAKNIGVDLETVARKATIDLFRAVGLRSPVGNPELWASNAQAMSDREQYNKSVDVANEAYAASGSKKRIRQASDKKLRKLFPVSNGKGYVGGRFRANWNVSVGSPDATITDSTDKNRVLTEVKKVDTLAVGGIMYLTNALPYAHRLEYEGWSSQAPAGMVRISTLEFGDHIKKALK